MTADRPIGSSLRHGAPRRDKRYLIIEHGDGRESVSGWTADHSTEVGWYTVSGQDMWSLCTVRERICIDRERERERKHHRTLRQTTCKLI